jgi:transposase
MNIDPALPGLLQPEPNPIERLWKVMNEQVRNNRYFTSAKVFGRNIIALSAKYYRDLPGYWRVVLMTTSRR